MQTIELIFIICELVLNIIEIKQGNELKKLIKEVKNVKY